MTTAAQPTFTSELAIRAAFLNARDWDEVFAGIPESHPRNESTGGAPAGVAGGAAGGQGAGDPAGGGGQGDQLYQPYLANVPAELHPMVLDPLRAQSADFTRRFQEAADFRQQMEPYSNIDGFADVPPDELAELIQFRQVLADPEALKGWVQQVSTALGVSPELDEDAWAALGQQNGWLEDDGTGAAAGGQNEILDQVAQMLDERLGPIQQHIGTQQQQQTQQQHQQAFEGRYNELAEQHGLVPEGTPPEKAAEIKQAVTDLAFAYVSDDDPIGKAVERYLSITGGAQGDLIDGKLQQQTGPTLTGGGAATQPEAASWNGGGPSPKDLALARMKS